VSAPVEIARTIQNYGLWSTLGWADIKFRYRRTMIGPFWLVISTGVTILAIGVLYAGLFRKQTADYIPYLACGMIIWGFVNTTIIEGCNVFITAAPIIKSSSIPLSVHVFRLLWRNTIIFLHSVVVILVAWTYYQWELEPSALFAIAGLIILGVFLFGLVLVLSVICTRFRDMPQIVTSLLQLLFFLSPIIWTPSEAMRASPIVWLNPFYSLIEVVRAPLLAQAVGVREWGIAIGSAALILVIGLMMYGRFRRLIAYWL
jgi:ABC-type polysaccharide/polyol phosphate export permease